MIYSFKAFGIKFILRINNVVVDTLDNATTRFIPLRDSLSIYIIYKLDVPNNVTNLRVFNDDQHILDFMENIGVFKVVTIYEEEHE